MVFDHTSDILGLFTGSEEDLKLVLGEQPTPSSVAYFLAQDGVIEETDMDYHVNSLEDLGKMYLLVHYADSDHNIHPAEDRQVVEADYTSLKQETIDWLVSDGVEVEKAISTVEDFITSVNDNLHKLFPFRESPDLPPDPRRLRPESEHDHSVAQPLEGGIKSLPPRTN